MRQKQEMISPVVTGHDLVFFSGSLKASHAPLRSQIEDILMNIFSSLPIQFEDIFNIFSSPLSRPSDWLNPPTPLRKNPGLGGWHDRGEVSFPQPWGEGSREPSKIFYEYLLKPAIPSERQTPSPFFHDGRNMLLRR